VLLRSGYGWVIDGMQLRRLYGRWRWRLLVCCVPKCGYLVTGHTYNLLCSYKRYKLLDFLYKLTISAAVHAIDDPLVPT
jgi:hypothetical protein